jgi:hypothetical protein
MNENARTRVGGPRDPREGLLAVVALRRTLEALEVAQVENAFIAGWSWAQIAEVLGVRKQAAHKKHARRIRDRYPREPLLGILRNGDGTAVRIPAGRSVSQGTLEDWLYQLRG